jgi:predicted transposase/invertase (TIGR01784 family)
VPIDEVKERLPVEGRKEFMSVADQLREEGKKEVAKRMLYLHMEVEQIIAATGLSEETINQLKKTLK